MENGMGKESDEEYDVYCLPHPGLQRHAAGVGPPCCIRGTYHGKSYFTAVTGYSVKDFPSDHAGQ